MFRGSPGDHILDGGVESFDNLQMPAGEQCMAALMGGAGPGLHIWWSANSPCMCKIDSIDLLKSIDMSPMHR